MSEISLNVNAAVGSASTNASAKENIEHLTESSPIRKEKNNLESQDSIDFSTEAIWLQKIHQLPEVRQSRIDAIKQAISNDQYLNDEKLNSAFDLLIEDASH